MANKTLVITTSDEPNVKRVLGFIPQDKFLRLNTDTFLHDSTFSFKMGGQNAGWHFRNGQGKIALEEIRAIWYRRPTKPKSNETLPIQHKDFVENEAHKFLQALWSTIGKKNVFWMNHPQVLRELEFNKPYQMQIASSVGLKIPNTLITNEPKEATEFFREQKGEVVVKTFGGSPLSDEENRPLAVYTNRVSEDDLLEAGDGIRYGPVMFQSYIPKAIELRITAVGEQLFACAIHSQDSSRTKDDWRRYDFDRVKHEPYRLPLDIAGKLRILMELFGISFGAIDMIVTPDGDYVFLEVNPSGQWGWIERITGMPISKAIADTLTSPRTSKAKSCH